MPPSSGSALALAARLRSLDEGALTALLRQREPRTAGLRDLVDVAERLLSPESLAPALARLDRPTLHALATGTPAPQQARDLALADPEGHPYDAVAAVLADWPARGLPSAAQLGEPAPPALGALDTEPGTVDARAAERAHATTSAVRELLGSLEPSPARELVRGGLALPDARRLAAAARTGLDDLPVLLVLAEGAGLAASAGGEWRTTPEAAAWFATEAPERWGRLALAWADRLQPDVRSVLAARLHVVWGEGMTEYVRWLYPAGDEWMQRRVADQLAAAEALGLHSGGVPSRAGAAVFAGDAGAAVEAVRPGFPHPVERAYLQNDLTIVATGPLIAPLDARLRLLADAEGGGLAGSYRVSAASIERALRAGETAETIRTLLETLSLTGVPQPLAYLLEETARRFALVRVAPLAGGGAVVRSVDDQLLRTIGVDAGLAVLHLREHDGTLVTGLRPEVVLWALTDARYPASLEDEHGAIVTVERPTPAATTAPREDPYATLAARLLAEATPGHGDGWVERQLEVAIRARAAVRVTVQLPDGSETTFLLEPTGLAGGRLRARDRGADIERTLPVARILDVSVPE